MRLYTVHVPDVGDEVKRADRTVFLREGFSVRAFVFGWLYLLWHRLWLAAAVWLATAVVLVVAAMSAQFPGWATLLLVLLMHLFVGLEGNDLRRWRLARKRFAFAEIVSGGGRTDAEYAYFHRRPSAPDVPAAALPGRVVPRDTAPTVIGMFPDENG